MIHPDAVNVVGPFENHSLVSLFCTTVLSWYETVALLSLVLSSPSVLLDVVRVTLLLLVTESLTKVHCILAGRESFVYVQGF